MSSLVEQRLADALAECERLRGENQQLREHMIVLDNARFHQSPTTLKLVEQAGCHLLFLPAYSPDLNPIEHLWAPFKTRLRKDPATATNPFLFIANMSQCYC